MAPSPPGRGRPASVEKSLLRSSSLEQQGDAASPHSLADEFASIFDEVGQPLYRKYMDEFARRFDQVCLAKASKIKMEENRIALEREQLEKEKTQLKTDQESVQAQKDFSNLKLQQVKDRELKVQQTEAQMIAQHQSKDAEREAELVQAKKKVQDLMEKSKLDAQRVSSIEGKLSEQMAQNLALKQEIEKIKSHNHKLIESLEGNATKNEKHASKLQKENDDLKSKMRQKNELISHLEKQWEEKERCWIQERNDILTRQAEKEKSLLKARKNEWIAVDDFRSKMDLEMEHFEPFEDKRQIERLCKIARFLAKGSKIYFKTDDLKELTLGMQIPPSNIISDITSSSGRDYLSAVANLGDKILKMVKSNHPAAAGTMSVCSGMFDD